MPLYQPLVFDNDIERSSVADCVDSTVGAVITKIINTNDGRRGLTFKNLGLTTVYFDQKDDVSATSHKFSLNAGGFYELPFLNEPYTGDWWAISSSGSNLIAIRETVV